MQENQTESTALYRALEARMALAEIGLVRADQERKEISRVTQRLEDTKASKEIVEAFRSEVAGLRVDMDKRFDRLENLVQNK